MKKYFFKIIIFTLGVILINTVIYFITDRYYFKPYENIEKINSNDTVFILADSHGGPLKQNLREFGVYNFSIGSDSYFDIYRKIVYLKKHSNIKKVIITADDHTLSIYRERLNNKDRSVHFLEISDSDILLEGRFSIFKEKYFKRYVPLFNPKTTAIVGRYFRSLFKKKKNTVLDWDTNDNKKKESVKRAKSQFRGTESSTELTECIRKTVELCKSYDIEIVTIKFPLAKDYLSEIKGRNFGADEQFRELGIKTYDFTELYINHDEYFANQDHLNDLGGELFAKELLKIVEAD
ncbi:MAG: hypothetical protein JXR69_08380 [Candidatus Delongbacteria bacterium]|nr:hypothetical protein [Candidatus Delongbacteria bacterium]